MSVLVLCLLICALVCFLLAAFGAFPRVSTGWLGMAFIAIAFIATGLPGLS